MQGRLVGDGPGDGGPAAPAQREVFLLVVVLGLSYQEVSGMTGCPAGTVASRVFRARVRLAAALRVWEEDRA